MNVEEFSYDLPPELIAQEPAPRRDASRMLVLERGTGRWDHRQFAELADLLRPADLLVLNDTRVVPARLVGRKASGGRVELLLLERVAGAPAEWNCWLRASHKPELGSHIEFEHGLSAQVQGRAADVWRVRFHAAAGDSESRLISLGQLPLPPYIRRADGAGPADRERYQTVYARHPGAVAAPTAGLHFTSELLDRLADRGVEIVALTLHVGPGTFEPVRSPTVEEHRLRPERYDVSPFLSRSIEVARRRGGRVVAVGTTAARALEWCATAGGCVAPGRGECPLFIYPGYSFRVVDALITNFHLPRSTLLMLVCAFAGREPLLAAYREAVRAGYRFYSYGDAMFVA